jgi:RNA recognition motif-containing protein
VRFATPAEAQAAIAAMNGAEIAGRAVQVREDKGPAAPAAAEGGEYA